MKATLILSVALALAASSQESTTDRSLANGVLRLTLAEQVEFVPEAPPVKPELIKLPPQTSGRPSAGELLKRSLSGCPAGCDCNNCPVGDCDCGCGCSLASTLLKASLAPPKPVEQAKPAKTVDLPSAFKNDFKHDCGCGSLPCNCFGPGGCHCGEHRAENRQPALWRHDGETWGLFRGKRQIGALDSKGVYHPYDSTADRWLPPCQPPVPAPQGKPQAQAALPVAVFRATGGSC